MILNGLREAETENAADNDIKEEEEDEDYDTFKDEDTFNVNIEDPNFDEVMQSIEQSE